MQSFEINEIFTNKLYSLFPEVVTKTNYPFFLETFHFLFSLSFVSGYKCSIFSIWTIWHFIMFIRMKWDRKYCYLAFLIPWLIFIDTKRKIIFEAAPWSERWQLSMKWIQTQILYSFENNFVYQFKLKNGMFNV